MNKDLKKLIGWGEEYISQIDYDAFKQEARIHIKNISRAGPNNNELGVDPDMCLDEGIFIIIGVKEMLFNFNNPLPYDLHELEILLTDDGLYKFIFDVSGDLNDEKTAYIPLTITILGIDAYMVDAKNPNIVII